MLWRVVGTGDLERPIFPASDVEQCWFRATPVLFRWQLLLLVATVLSGLRGGF